MQSSPTHSHPPHRVAVPVVEILHRNRRTDPGIPVLAGLDQLQRFPEPLPLLLRRLCDAERFASLIARATCHPSDWHHASHSLIVDRPHQPMPVLRGRILAVEDRLERTARILDTELRPYQHSRAHQVRLRIRIRTPFASSTSRRPASTPSLGVSSGTGSTARKRTG